MSPRACSGLMYDGVPIVVPCSVSPDEATVEPGETRLGHPVVLRRDDVALADHLGQPPVDDQGLAVPPQHDVGRLQVAVEHPAAVRVVDRVANVEKPPEQLPELDAPRRPLARVSAPAVLFDGGPGETAGSPPKSSLPR